MLVITLPLGSRSLAYGHHVAELPGRPLVPPLRIHTVEAGATATWTGHARPRVLLVLEGLGRLAVDGAVQRCTGPCALGLPAGTTLGLTNQGTWPMRVVEVGGAVDEAG